MALSGAKLATFGLVINGETVDTGVHSFPVFDPVTQDVVHYAPTATTAHARAAVETAEAAFATWRETTPIKRRSIMLKAVEVLQARQDELVQSMVQETGAKPSWAAFNIRTGLSFVQEAAGMTTQIKGDLLQSNDHGTLAMVFREPCGVILGIAPWNAPIILGIRAFITPLICGNTVVLKASENSPRTQYLLVDAFREAGLPAGVLNFLCCPRSSAAAITEAMVSHPAVQRINFTGSTAVGRLIAAMSAKYLKPTILELGGKAPMVVLKHANVAEAVRAAAFGAMQHQGQICMSTERIIIHKSIAVEFAKLMKGKVRQTHRSVKPYLQNYPRTDSTAALGSLISPVAGSRVEKLMADALAKGATAHGGRFAVDGAIVQPLVLQNVRKDMDIYYQESFGPVVSLFEFETNEEAIRLANDTEYGLVASVFGDDIQDALAVARRIRSGSCHINGPTVHDEPHLPLGGQKASGYGKFGGMLCINEFTEERVVTIGSHGHHYPI